MAGPDAGAAPEQPGDAAPPRLGRIGRVWRWFRALPVVRIALSPASTLSLAFLTLGGFLMGVVFWGAFNTALEATNRTDFSLMKDVVIREAVRMQLRGEFFNAFNQVTLGAPNTSASSATFGRITSASSGREIQLAMKLVW